MGQSNQKYLSRRSRADSNPLCSCTKNPKSSISLNGAGDALQGLLDGVSPESLRVRADVILSQIDRRTPREPGEDDE
jgi:hypothetical protein